MKKWIPAGIAAAVIAALAGGAAVFHANYAILGGNLFTIISDPEYDGIYRLDETVLWPDKKLTAFNVRELNRCTAVEDLMLESTDDETLETLRSFESLTTLSLLHPDEPLAETAFDFVNRQPALEELLLVYAETDCSAAQSGSLRTLKVMWGSLSHPEGLAACPALEELHLCETVIGEHLHREDETPPEVNQYYTDADGKGFVIRPMDAVRIRYYLDDSSDLAALDQVKMLSLSSVTLNDVTGILDMDGLETLRLYKCELPDDNRKLLEERGIAIVIEENE